MFVVIAPPQLGSKIIDVDPIVSSIAGATVDEDRRQTVWYLAKIAELTTYVCPKISDLRLYCWSRERCIIKYHEQRNILSSSSLALFAAISSVAKSVGGTSMECSPSMLLSCLR